MQTKKGKLIAIEGTDGSGKATQAKLLAAGLRRDGARPQIICFPRYGKKSAWLVENYLAGQYGSAREVGPYRAATFYAADRYDAGFKIRKWLTAGKTVIADRYVISNLAHQGGKIADPKKRKLFFTWALNLEYEIFKIPRPDINIILHVPIKITRILLNARGRKNINYSRPDIHETDSKHLRSTEKTYLKIARDYPEIKLIECTRNNKILTRQEIHDKLWQIVKKYCKDGG